MNVEKTRRTLKILRQAVSEDDIDKLYGEDQPTLEMIKDVARSDLPDNIDLLIEDALTDFDVEFGALDVPEKDLVRVLVTTAFITGTKIKLNVLMTEVKEIVARAEPASAVVTTLEASLVPGCPACGEELDNPDVCSDCGWQSDNPIDE